MKNTRKILLALLVVMTLLVSMAVVASAAQTTAPTTIYLTPNSNWKVDNARFAVYTWDGGDQWFDMSDPDGDGVYECVLPAGIENIIFCRMSPTATANNWTNKWNQTADLKYDGTNNHYTVKEGTWDKGGGTWSIIQIGGCVHTPAGGGNVITPATCTENGEISHTCSKCGEEYKLPIAALGHTYDANGMCACGASKFTVAGSNSNNEASIFGTAWDVSNSANDLAYDESTGDYVKVYKNVPAGNYKFKVVEDHSWNVSYGDSGSGDPDGNAVFSVTEAGSTVTIYFNSGAISVKVSAASDEPEHTHNFVDGKCECGESDPNYQPPHEHNFVDGKCECGESDPNYIPDTPITPDPEVLDYYLVGYINGADYGCADDYATIGDYKFVDGKLSVVFEAADNYVFIKTGDNNLWYMSEAYCTDTTVTLANTEIGTAEKLYVPGNVEITFTLVVNADDTLTLSYTTGASVEPTPDPDPTPDTDKIYIIAGDVMRDENGAYVEGLNFFGSVWDITDENNMLVYDEALGCYVKVFENVFMGEYHFKVAENKSWDVSYGENGGQNNCYFKVEEDLSTVTITFKNGVPAVTVTGPADPDPTPDPDPNPDPDLTPDPDPTPDENPDEQPEAELNFFQKILKAITDFFANIGNWFKNLFAKK